jgi:hypothetical protein
MDYMKEQNERTLMVIQVESPEGLNNLDEIMAVEGIDVAFIGPNDLSLSLGVMGQYNNPIFIDAVDKVVFCLVAPEKRAGRYARLFRDHRGRRAMETTPVEKNQRGLHDSGLFILHVFRHRTLPRGLTGQSSLPGCCYGKNVTCPNRHLL